MLRRPMVSARRGAGFILSRLVALSAGACVLLAGCGGGNSGPTENARLASLIVAQVTLMPDFDSRTFDYTAEVANSVTSTTVTPTAAQSAATVTVNGQPVNSGSASTPIALTVGENTIRVVVTAENGTSQRTYTVVLTRRAPPSNNADLASLVLTTATLDQVFVGSMTSYTASTGYLGASTRIVAVPENDQATVTFDGETLTSGEPSHYLPLAVGDNSVQVQVTAEDGATSRTYGVDVQRANAVTLNQQAYIKASNTGPDRFGEALSLSQDTLVVGAPDEASASGGIDGDQGDNSLTRAGAAYVFTRAGLTWTQSAYLKAAYPGALDRFGGALAIDGNLLLVGAEGEQSASRGIDGDQRDDSSSLVGAVYAFERDGGQWSQTAYLKASNSGQGDRFGAALDLDGDRAVVGAWAEDSGAMGVDGDGSNNDRPNAGAAYAFSRDASGRWTQEGYLKASNTDAGDQFGRAVSISGATAAIGAPYEDSEATGVGGTQSDNGLTDSGAAYVLSRDAAGRWSQDAYIKASNTGTGDHFGASIALDGDLLAVGAPDEDSAAAGIGDNQLDNTLSNAGAVYVFARGAGGRWSQVAYVKASNPGFGDGFGSTVAIEGNVLVVGAPNEGSAATGIGGDGGNDSAPNAGAVYVFERGASGSWRQIAYVKASNTGSGDGFGSDADIDGDTLAAGAPFEDGGDTGVDGNQSDNSVSDAGAAYVVQ